MHVGPVIGLIEAHCKVSDTHPIIDTPATMLHKGNCIVTFCTSTNVDVIADVGCVPVIPVLKNVATATNADGIARFSSLWSHNLAPNESARFVSSFSPSSDVFASSTSELGRGSIVRETINTNDARLIKQPPYRFALNAGANGFPSCFIFGRAPRLPLGASLPLPNSCASTSVSQLHFD